MKPKRTGRYSCVVQHSINLISQGRLKEAVDTLPLLSSKGFSLSSKVYASLIQQCANSKRIREGKLVHLHLKITGSKRPMMFCSNHLINMYAKCGDHYRARQVFDKMRNKNLYSWNNMLAGYANLGMINAARELFNEMPERDFVSWNTMVMACVQTGLFSEALRLYVELRRSEIGFNEFSFAGVLTACVKLRNPWLAKQFHCQVFIVGFLSNVVLSSSIVDAYAKSGELGYARHLFDEVGKRDVLTWTTLVSGYAHGGDMKSAREIFDAMPDKNSVSWTALITGYAHNRMGCDALKLLQEMIRFNVEPTKFTISSCLFACCSISSFELGRQLHSYLIALGIRANAVVGSSLIDMYSKCGRLDSASRVFHTIEDKKHVVLWNAMILALVENGHSKEAIKAFIDMTRAGLRPEGATFLVLVNACKNSGLVQEGLSLFKSMFLDYYIVPEQDHYMSLIDLVGQSGDYDVMRNQLKAMQYKCL